MKSCGNLRFLKQIYIFVKLEVLLHSYNPDFFIYFIHFKQFSFLIHFDLRSN